MDKLIDKVGRCIDFKSLWCMEEDVNRVGLTIQRTHQNNMILCRVQDGTPLAERIVEDYIFVGDLGHKDSEISDKARDQIVEFIKANAGQPSCVKNVARTWRNGLRLYENSITIDIGRIGD